ncbi:A24 family peptidase [Bengtsoniella intestinalis]|uniref:prepilin peptidase n=1 Tax=Bengtsoniella intestinalis TaxID=3073143 RepID=UPI00391F3889
MVNLCDLNHWHLLLFGVPLLLATYWDIRWHIIPNWLCATVFCVGFVAFQPSHLLGIFIALPLLIGALVERNSTHSIGGGDIKFTAACGFVLGVQTGMVGLMLGLCLFVVYYAIKGVALPQKKGQPMPMAPSLSAGFTASFIIAQF